MNRPLGRNSSIEMVNNLAQQAGIARHICNHTFRATGITAYLRNGGKLETAWCMAGHGSPDTTKIYDGRRQEISISEVERIRL